MGATRKRTQADLGAHNCLAYTLAQTTGVDRWMFGRDGQTAAPIRGNLRASNDDALVAAAVADQGLIYQPTFLVGDDLLAGRLVAVHLDLEAAELTGIFAV